MSHQEERGLELPIINEKKINKIKIQPVPFRKGGLRIEHQIINDRHIFHNYGHGSAAVSLAYGSAYISSKQADLFLNPYDNIDCAVVGSGVIGLSTAIELNRRGHKVTIYTQEIPEFNSNLNENSVFSQVLPVVWMPSDYDWSQDLVKHELIAKLSYDFLKQSIDLKRYQSLKTINVFDRSRSLSEIKQIVSDHILDTFKDTTLKYGDGNREPVVQYQTLSIDAPLMIEELRVQAQLRGVNFVKRKFNNLHEFLSLNEHALFNCTGSSSEYLFEDKNFKRNTKIVVHLTEQYNHKDEFVLKGNQKGFDLYCIGKKTILVLDGSDLQKLSKQQIKQKLNEVIIFTESKNKRAKL